MGTCGVADKLTEVGTKAQSAEETATEETEAEWGENIKAAAAEEETAAAEARPPRSRRLHCDGVDYSTVASRKMRKAESTAAEEAVAAGKAETTTEAALKKGVATEEVARPRDKFRQPEGRQGGKALHEEFLPKLRRRPPRSLARRLGDPARSPNDLNGMWIFAGMRSHIPYDVDFYGGDEGTSPITHFTTT